MKKSLLFIFASLIVSAIAMPAWGAGFSFTVNWDNPGALQIIKGGMSSPVLTIEEGITSWTGSEPDSYYLKPAPGYIILSVHEKYVKADTQQEVDRDKQLGTSHTYGQYCNISTYSLLNGAVYTVTTKKLADIGSLTLDIANGADKIEVYFKNDVVKGAGEVYSTYTRPELMKGAHEVRLSENDRYINIYPLGSTKIFKVELNGGRQELKPSYGGYEFAVKPGDKVAIRVFEEDLPACDVDVKFTNDENCLRDIYNRATGKFVYPEQLTAMNNRLSVDKGDILRFNYHEDFDVSAIKVNGKDVPVTAGGYDLAVEENTSIEFTAAAKVYEDVPVTLYLKSAEGIVIRKGAFDEDEEIVLGEGEDLVADVIFDNSNDFVIKAGEARKYTVSVPGKTKKFFWSARPGYWVENAVMGNPEDEGYTWPSPGVSVEQAPVYLAAKKISTENILVFFLDGEEKEAKSYAKNSKVAGQLPFPGLVDNYIPVGYTMSSFDPEYHQIITAGKVGGSRDKALEIVVNGVKQQVGDDGSFAFALSADMAPAIVKVFSRDKDEATGEVRNPVRNLTVVFENETGCGAEVTYDRIFSHTDLTQPLTVVGKTLVSIRPAYGTFVKVDGEYVDPNADGLCEFWTEKNRHTVELTASSALDNVAVGADADKRVYNLQGIEMKSDFNQLPAGIYICNGQKLIRK